ncbi:MAG: hypothetical protein ACREEB_00885, partial [Caulobacteraceae bacterium]
HGANVGLDGAVTISGWGTFGSFSGLHGSVNHAGGSGTLTLSLVPANAGGAACIHVENNGQVDMEGSGTITVGGGTGLVTTVFDGDSNGSFFSTLATTSDNASTPANSQVFSAVHGASVILVAPITATHFTYSCTAHEGGSADQGSGGRTFTNVGSTNVANTGTCTLF